MALLKDGEVRKRVRARMAEFERIGKSDERAWFKELSFCLLTANFRALSAFSAIVSLDKTALLYKSDRHLLSAELRRLGHRFYETRARYIVAAREKIAEIYSIIPSLRDQVAREWLAANVKGLGMKESSHFLRNIGKKDLAIIDRHVARLVVGHGLMPSIPKTMTKKEYLRFEDSLRGVAKLVGLSLAELDLYLWYMAKGIVFR